MRQRRSNVSEGHARLPQDKWPGFEKYLNDTNQAVELYEQNFVLNRGNYFFVFLANILNFAIPSIGLSKNLRNLIKKFLNQE